MGFSLVPKYLSEGETSMRCAYGSGPPSGQNLQWILSQSHGPIFSLYPSSSPVSPTLVWDPLRMPCPLPWKVPLHLHTRNSQDAFLWRKPFTSGEIQLPLSWMTPLRLVVLLDLRLCSSGPFLRAWGEGRRREADLHVGQSLG